MIEPWSKLKEEPFRAGFRRMVKKFFRLPDGRETDFDIKDEEEAVCILAMTTDKQIILAKQFRPGPEKILLEMPGGNVEKNEEPLPSVQRELAEETGYTGNVELVGTVLDDAYSNRLRYVYVATDCRPTEALNPDENEFIEIVLVGLPEFRELLRSGEMTDVECGYLALDYLKLL